MLIPAAIRKQEILDNFKQYYYTDDMMYETGGLRNWIPEIADNPDECTYQYAMVNNKNKLIGFVSYKIDWYSLCAFNFGLISFDRGNPIVGKELFNILEDLIHKFHMHRIEWKMIDGNPVQKSYDKFCEKYGGTKYTLKDVCKDKYGKYHNNIIYEIINEDN